MPRRSLRDELLSAGLATLHRKGFNGTSVQDITDAAGAPKGSFYNHFESKEALAIEAVRAYTQRGRARLAILRDEKTPPLRRLRRYFESWRDAAVEAGFSSGCLLGNFGAELSAQSPRIRNAVAAAFAGWRDALASVIEQAQEEGTISRAFPSKALAEYAIEALEGAILRAKVEQDRAPLDLFVKLTLARILS